MEGLQTRAVSAHCDEIRATIGIVALLHAGDELSQIDIKNAVARIERELAAIGRVARGEAETIPLLTIGEVAARFGHRSQSEGDLRRAGSEGDLCRAPKLTVIDGGRA